MSKYENSRYDYLVVLFAANIPCLGLLLLSGWFAYLDNGQWGWPFGFAIATAVGLKSWKEKKEEEREEAIERAKVKKQYGDIFNN